MLEEIKQDLYKSLIVDDRYIYILEGLRNTILIAFFAIIIGTILGSILALVIYFNEEKKKNKILTFICKSYINIIRGTPVVLQLMIIYYIIFRSITDINLIFVGALAFGINSSAYVAEIIRAGINSVEKGQMEAALSLGLSVKDSMKHVIMPQAIKVILPTMGNEFIALIKETAVAGYIGIMDLTKSSDIIASRTYDYFFPLIIVAVIYFCIVVWLTRLFGKLEKRLNNA